MKRCLSIVALLLGVASLAHAQAGFTGSWITTGFANAANPSVIIVLKADGGKLAGTISDQAGTRVVDIKGGTVARNTATFTVTLPAAARVITFTGRLNGDAIAFTRSVKVRDAASNVGTGVYGAKAPMRFTANREHVPVTAMNALYGHWREDIAQSTFSADPPGVPILPSIYQFGALRDGAFTVLAVGVNELGVPGFGVVPSAKLDGADYPVYQESSVEKPAETDSFKLGDAGRVLIVVRVNNVVTENVTLTVSPDNQESTALVSVVDAAGKETAHSTVVYHRIP